MLIKRRTISTFLRHRLLPQPGGDGERRHWQPEPLLELVEQSAFLPAGVLARAKSDDQVVVVSNSLIASSKASSGSSAPITPSASVPRSAS